MNWILRRFADLGLVLILAPQVGLVILAFLLLLLGLYVFLR